MEPIFQLTSLAAGGPVGQLALQTGMEQSHRRLFFWKSERGSLAMSRGSGHWPRRTGISVPQSAALVAIRLTYRLRAGQNQPL